MTTAASQSGPQTLVSALSGVREPTANGEMFQSIGGGGGGTTQEARTLQAGPGVRLWPPKARLRGVGGADTGKVQAGRHWGLPFLRE